MTQNPPSNNTGLLEVTSEHFRAFLQGFSQNRPTHSLILLLTAGCVALLAIRGSAESWVTAGVVLFLLAPAMIVVLDNLRSWVAETKSDSWPGWLIFLALANLATGAVTLLMGLEKILPFTLLLAGLVLIRVLLPRLLTRISRTMGRIPRLGTKLRRWLSPPALYGLLVVALVLIVLWPSLSRIEPDDLGNTAFWLNISLLILFLASAIGFRSFLWRSSRDSLIARTLPHIVVWNWILLDFLYRAKDWLAAGGTKLSPIYLYGGFRFTIPATILLISGYWLFQRLRRSPVEPPEKSGAERADSIQSRVAHYVDVHGLSERLVNAVKDSDGGVFGVTGVRGAGKSALTRHVRSRLKPHCFTLESTAPVRHDQDMGFLIALCRQVCQKILEDLAPILQGGDEARAAGSGDRRAIRCWRHWRRWSPFPWGLFRWKGLYLGNYYLRNHQRMALRRMI
uniref:AAA ATPase domain-containing protein n=1 Tax=Candidatus Kentrum sp. UNK TaxID=2126344 RepID=A0A451B153_9GAMM|nr:MAG: AAA ATPase domain-containing protein [Candidatus Kentron sp. UNK]VFK72004.1 MAG: AAA ATPase domain-containing protein [Candidatus Kentron sp. UNK]